MLLKRAALAVILAASAFSACSSGGGGDVDAGPACGPYFGDPAAAPEIELVALKDYTTEHPLADGDDFMMLTPPQGGRVVFVGVRVKNVDGCSLTLTGALRDPTTKQVRVDQRTVRLRDAGGGWGQSGGIAAGGSADISSYANIPVCPNFWASTNVYDEPFTLEVTIKDRRGKTATKSISVVPRCAPEVAECRCRCAHGYVNGQPCDRDASPQSDAASD